MLPLALYSKYLVYVWTQTFHRIYALGYVQMVYLYQLFVFIKIVIKIECFIGYLIFLIQVM